MKMWQVQPQFRNLIYISPKKTDYLICIKIRAGPRCTKLKIEFTEFTFFKISKIKNSKFQKMNKSRKNM